MLIGNQFMYKVITLLKITTATLLFCVSAYAAPISDPAIKRENGEKHLLLPDHFIQAINVTFPGYRIPSLEDMTGPWGYFKTNTEFLPFICWGDYSGDGLTDIAVLLINDTAWKDVIFNKTARGYQLAHKLEGVFEDTPDGIARPQQFLLQTLKKDEELVFENQDEKIIFKHELDSVQSALLEEEVDVIFWKNGAYKTRSFGE